MIPTLRNVDVSNRARPRLRIPRGSVPRLLHWLDRNPSIPPPVGGDLSVVFLGWRSMCRLHEQFLGDPSPTDVITFPATEPGLEGGEICVCPEMADRNARQLGLPFARELTLYLVHGWLHLAGYEDHTPAQRSRMRAAENVLMEGIHHSIGIPSFHWIPPNTR